MYSGAVAEVCVPAFDCSLMGISELFDRPAIVEVTAERPPHFCVQLIAPGSGSVSFKPAACEHGG